MNGFCPLASGSKGNSMYLGTKDTKVLIDAGISVKQLAARLQEIQVDIEDIDAVLVTHEHTDHVKGLSALCSKYGIPVFANSETAKAILPYCTQVPKFKIFSTGETFEFGDIEIHPFSIQHDAMDPVAFTFQIGPLKVGLCTDLGFASTLVVHQLQDCDYLCIEANHQPSMVHASSRPMVYKQRVLSRQGHLSNEASAELISSVFHEKLKHVYLAHLSSECNAPDLALKIVEETLNKNQQRTSLSIAYQEQISQPVLF
jgi:phosphoribosyl 1,2-cyclic phosphodiesterase